MSNKAPRYWAHSDPDGKPVDDQSSHWQPLRDHLCEVAALAESLARATGRGDDFAARARIAGLLHDFGKYSHRFQRRIQGEQIRAPHAIYGAALACAADIAFAVSGHHAGMPDKAVLNDSVTDAIVESSCLLQAALNDFPDFAQWRDIAVQSAKLLQSLDPLGFDIHCRILLSCLVDADRLNTAAHSSRSTAKASVHLRADERLASLLAAIDKRSAEVPDGRVKTIRREILDDALDAASKPGALFSMTVPTGGGKTFAAMAFALRRAVLQPEIRRVIVVIPYLSIIEQNARVYRAALGDDAVLEHHSGVLGRDADEGEYVNPSQRVEMENWDAPIVVTTSVRFFETLFSNHPRDLRRMHNIARSVVILDEIQTMPRGYVEPTLSLLNGLAESWQTTFVFSTATQPAFERRPTASARDPGMLTTEMMPDPRRLFERLRRVKTTWLDGEVTWTEMADKLEYCHQALVIMNTRTQALALFTELSKRTGGVLHLSNNMCPAHRLERLEEIRQRLASGSPCLVVATQLVEAGVDLDFPVVWRASGPLDSIAQAAGRCDRGGILTDAAGEPAGQLFVFTPAKGGMPKGAYQQGAEITRVLAAGGYSQWDDPETIRIYFDRLYGGEGTLDAKEVQEARKRSQFKTISDKVQWIEEATVSVIVPFDEPANALIKEIRFAGVNLDRFRRAQKYVVGLWDADFKRGRALGAIYEAQPEVWVCPEGIYDSKVGIRFDSDTQVV